MNTVIKIYWYAISKKCYSDGSEPYVYEYVYICVPVYVHVHVHAYAHVYIYSICIHTDK